MSALLLLNYSDIFQQHSWGEANSVPWGLQESLWAAVADWILLSWLHQLLSHALLCAQHDAHTPPFESGWDHESQEVRLWNRRQNPKRWCSICLDTCILNHGAATVHWGGRAATWRGHVQVLQPQPQPVSSLLQPPDGWGGQPSGEGPSCQVISSQPSSCLGWYSVEANRLITPCASCRLMNNMNVLTSAKFWGGVFFSNTAGTPALDKVLPIMNHTDISLHWSSEDTLGMQKMPTYYLLNEWTNKLMHGSCPS